MSAASTQKGLLPHPQTLLSEDDFSIKATVEGDHLFWVRIEKPLSDPLVVTDFFPGQQSAETLAKALKTIIDTKLHTSLFSRVCFTNILRGEEISNNNVELERVLSQMTAAVESSFDLAGQSKPHFELKNRGGKVDVEFNLKTS